MLRFARQFTNVPTQPKMNIAFFTFNEINPFIGGIEKVTYNLTNFFRQRGINVYTFSLNGTEKQWQFILPKTDCRQAICDYIDRKVKEHNIQIIIDQYGTADYMLHGNLHSDVKIIRCIHYNFIERHISECLLKTLSLSRLRYSFLNVLFWLNTPRRRYREMANLKRWVKGVDRLVFLSPSYFDFFPDQRYRHKLRAIPNAVTLQQAGEAALADKENVLLFCGRLVQSPKNIVYLLQLWRRLCSDYPTWKMVLCGDGIDRVAAESYISKHKLPRVSITGFTDPNPYYKKAKILVFPSLSEGFSMAILEAMSWGCVPVVFDSSPAYNGTSRISGA